MVGFLVGYQNRCKITAFLLHTQLFMTKNATNLRKNITKNRLFSCMYEKKAVHLRKNSGSYGKIRNRFHRSDTVR